MTDEEILLLIRSGGPARNAGVGHLYRAYGNPLMRFFVQRGASGDEAQDILQVTFIKIVSGVASWAGDGPARAWIWQIARNCLTDHFRQDGRRLEVEVAVNDDSWERPIETVPSSVGVVGPQSVDECVASGLGTFLTKEPERAFVLDLHLEGLSMEEIGIRIGRTVAATKEYLSQCRKKLKPYVEHCHDLLQA